MEEIDENGTTSFYSSETCSERASATGPQRLDMAWVGLSTQPLVEVSSPTRDSMLPAFQTRATTTIQMNRLLISNLCASTIKKVP